MWGALGGIRTPSLLIRSQMLYPLSYERRCEDELRAVPGAASNSPREPVAWPLTRKAAPSTRRPKGLSRLEDAREDMVDLMLATLGDHPDAALRVHTSDAAFWAAPRPVIVPA